MFAKLFFIVVTIAAVSCAPRGINPFAHNARNLREAMPVKLNSKYDDDVVYVKDIAARVNEIMAAAKEVPRSIAACPNYPHCDKKINKRYVREAVPAYPIAFFAQDSVKIREAAFPVPPSSAEIEAAAKVAPRAVAACPNYPYCDKKLNKRYVREAVPAYPIAFSAQDSVKIREAAFPVPPSSAEIEAAAKVAPRAVAECPNYPYCR